MQVPEIDALFEWAAENDWITGDGQRGMLTREQLSQFGMKAFTQGGECMSDQISEDYFGGRSNIKAQYENMYDIHFEED